MPSKIQLDENLWFLYICLQKSDLKSIDFAAVGQATNLKPPAARMRYTRLRRQIESGTLIGTHGTPFLSSSPSTKRKIMGNDKAEDESEEELGVKRDWWARKVDVKGERKVKKEGLVKLEESDALESGGSESEWDSEDEVPLAKLRKAKLGLGCGPATQGHTSSASVVAGTEGREVHLEGVVGQAFTAGNGRYQDIVSGPTVPRYELGMEGGLWEGMIPTGNVGIDSTYAAYGDWGNVFQGGIGRWDQSLQLLSGKPRKSI